jgi:hypothetical protein
LLPKVEMSFARHVLALTLPRLILKFDALAVDPTHPGDNCYPHGIVTDGGRGGNTHTAVRWIDAQVQVLDRLADQLNPQLADFERLSTHDSRE